MRYLCPRCGGHKFFARQVVRLDIVVDGNDNLDYCEDAFASVTEAMYDAEKPYGPYECTVCGWEGEREQMREEES